VVAGVGVWQLIGSSDPDDLGASAAGLVQAVTDAAPASEPFEALTETHVTVGEERLSVVVADFPNERSQGLRRRETIGPYDGMLFVYSEPVASAFTMSTVPVPLDIGFYDAEGRLVSRLRMEPCAGTDEECPLYRPDAAFVYALETLAGDLPEGALAAA
jgi:hypothetical protein